MRMVLAVALALGLSAPAEAQSRYNWDALGEAYCARSASADLAGLSGLFSDALRDLLARAATRVQIDAMPALFQSYSNPVTACSARTRNAALVDIERTAQGTSWTEYLVIVPERDGTTRIDDVLFAARRSDTLRARLKRIAGQ